MMVDYFMLYSALEHKHKEIAKLLIQAECQVNNLENSNIKDTPLTLSFALRDSELVNMLLMRGAKIDVRNKDGSTPLHLAAKNKFWSILKNLVDSCSDVNICDSSGRTVIQVLFETNSYDNHEIIKVLVLKGAKLDFKVKNGQSPLHLAVKSIQKDIIRTLLQVCFNVFQTTWIRFKW